jgi:hypothetical protein
MGQIVKQFLKKSQLIEEAQGPELTRFSEDWDEVIKNGPSYSHKENYWDKKNNN